MCLPRSPDAHKQAGHAYTKPGETLNRKNYQFTATHPGGSYVCSQALSLFPYLPITCRLLIQHKFYWRVASMEYIEPLLSTCD